MRDAFGVEISKAFDPEKNRTKRNTAEVAALGAGSAGAAGAAAYKSGKFVGKLRRMSAEDKGFLKVTAKAGAKPVALAAGSAGLAAGAVAMHKDKSKGGRPYKSWYN